MRHIAVFDTNVLFSGVGWKGKPFQCLELARTGMVDAATCREILDELTEHLQTKLNLSAEMVTETLADLLSFLSVVKIAHQLKTVPADPDDDKILECALSAKAGFVVTGDRRHLLPLGSFQGVRIITPADFLQIVAAASNRSA